MNQLIIRALRYLICLTGLMIAGQINADELATDNVIGQKFTIDSQVLNESRDIQIYFPPSYDQSKADYPVLYILDGQRLHLLGVSILQSFRSNVKKSPEFIVIGINNHQDKRFEHFKKLDFLEFIEKELVPHIDKNYRTSNERVLFGWEFAGAYVVEALMKKPGLFSGHIAASPYPVHQTWFAPITRLEMLEKKLDKLDSHLYFSVSDGEQLVGDGTAKLNALLESKAPSSLRWKYRVIPDEEHLSTAHATLYQGLKDYFYPYEEFQIYSLDKFEKAGGLKNFYKHNKLRAKRYGFDEQPSAWSMFTIVRNAIRADDFEKFKLYMNEFKDSNMIADSRLGNANSIAQFYVKYKAHNQAISVYLKMAQAHPDNARIHNELGDIYVKLNDKAKAKMHYKNSVELAKKSDDSRLGEYKKDLAQL